MTISLIKTNSKNLDILKNKDPPPPDMEKGADARTLSAEIFENCGNIWIVEDYSPIFSEKHYILWKYLIKH